jgi:ubiquinone/menaquinone biosynthesis C-methylase UbiE
MASNSPEYHLAELALARATNDPRRILPDIPADARRVLDIGCGAGQTLLACAAENRQAVGVDYDFEALRLGASLNVPASLAQATGEQLPFRDASFDFVFSRVALPYMKIPAALAEIARVLQPGGRVWFALHPLDMFSWQSFAHPRSAAYELYRLLNTASLHYGGLQFRYPLRPSRTESYQTPAGIRRALQRAGFDEIQLHRTAQHCVVAARHPNADPRPAKLGFG